MSVTNRKVDILLNCKGYSCYYGLFVESKSGLKCLILEHLIVMSFNPLLLQTFIHLVYIFSIPNHITISRSREEE